MSLDHIHLSQQAKDQLIRLKTKTGIQHWNVLCRWAFCLSLAEPTIPAPVKIPADSNVEMTWKVFGGQYDDIYMALLRKRCHIDGCGCSEEILIEYFKLHLHRGIGYLFANKAAENISNLVEKITKIK